MSINKYDKLIQKDWSWKTAIPQLPQLDYQALDSLLAQNQQQIDQVNLLSEKNPNVLNTEHDRALYQEYRKSADQGLQEVTNAYMQSPTQGGLAYKRFLNQIRKDWQPGGRADVLNKRYSGYQQALKESNDFYKDETDPVNKFLSNRSLQEQLNQPIEYDPSTGSYKSISTPELYKNPNINKAVDEMLKEIKANGTTQFLGDFNRDWWIQKIQNETREPERIKLAFEALRSQPQYQSQIERDVKYRAAMTNEDLYKSEFEAKQNKSLSYINDTYEKAKSDPKKTKEWQSFLQSQGYNLDVDGKFGPRTKELSEEYLAKNKKQVEDNINNFNFTDRLRSDVIDSYEGYALRGVYQKTEIDPIFNQAKKAMLDDARKREENDIARKQYELAAKDQSQILVTDGIAQQLPDVQKYTEEVKVNRDALKNSLDQAISKSDVFRGWTLGNIGEAYMKWQNIGSGTEEEKKQRFKKALNQGGSYQFTDKQVQALYEQMNTPDSSEGFKSMLKSYNDANNEVERMDRNIAHISEQYIETPEGKSAISILNPYRQPGETDANLAKRAQTNPEQFVRQYESDRNPNSSIAAIGENDARKFIDIMQKDVKKQEKEGKNYNWTDLNTFEVYAGNKDTTLRPVYDMTSQAIETGSGLNFSTFGMAGLTFKNNKGEEIDGGEARKVDRMAVTKNLKGEPILKVGVKITASDGKTRDGYTEVALVPGSALQAEVYKGMTEAYIQKVKQGEVKQAQGILDNLQAMELDNGVRNAAMDAQIKDLNLKNTSDNNLYIFKPETNSLVPASNLGWYSKDLHDDQTIGGFKYKTYGISTREGNVAANVMIDNEGRKIIVPSDTGLTYKSTSGISKYRKSQQILSNADAEVTKLPKGLN